jgi:rod shape-determining protein MreD
MSYYIGLPLLLVLALMEASVLPLFRVAGLQPNLVLVLLIAWLMLRGPNEAFILIPVGGLFLGLVDGAPLGTALLGLAPLAFLHEARGAQLREGGLLLTVMFTVFMTFSFHLAYLTVFTLYGENGDWFDAATRVFMPTAFLNCIVLLPAYYVVSVASQDLRRAGYV